ncbi:MAG TPA: hypothetical protein VF945_05390 [Polyangia bacterium]
MRIATCLALIVAAAGCGGSRASSDGSAQPDAPDLAMAPEPTAPDLALPGGGLDGDGGTHDGDGGVVAVPNGTATISGDFNGYQVAPVRSVVSVVTGQSFEVYLSDRADLCTIMQMGSSPKDTSIFRIGSSAGMAGHTFPAGAYTYPSGSGSGTGGGTGGGGSGGGGGGGNGMGTRDAVIMRSGANCIFDGYNQASAGSFTIDAAVPPNATEIDGTFDITFTVGGQMATFSGTFKAPVCPHATDVPETPIYCE